MAEVLTVLLGSSPWFRRWIKQRLIGSNLVIVAEAATLGGAMTKLGAGSRVDLGLLDSLSISAGRLAELGRIRLLLPRAKIVVLAARPSVDLARAALDSGVDGCLSSTMPGEAFIQSLNCIVLGQSLFSADGATLFLGRPVRGDPIVTNDEPVAMPTHREVVH